MLGRIFSNVVLTENTVFWFKQKGNILDMQSFQKKDLLFDDFFSMNADNESNAALWAFLFACQIPVFAWPFSLPNDWSLFCSCFCIPRDSKDWRQTVFSPVQPRFVKQAQIPWYALLLFQSAWHKRDLIFFGPTLFRTTLQKTQAFFSRKPLVGAGFSSTCGPFNDDEPGELLPLSDKTDTVGEGPVTLVLEILAAVMLADSCVGFSILSSVIAFAYDKIT